MLTAIPTTLMRGGTSKGLYFAKDALPEDRAARDRVNFLNAPSSMTRSTWSRPKPSRT